MARTGRPPRDQEACNTFASKLDAIMTEQRYRNADLAEAVKTPAGTVSKWRNGKQYPSGQALTKTARELNTTVEHLTG